MQPTGTVGTILIEDHPGSIPVKFGQNPISGFRGDVGEGRELCYGLNNNFTKMIYVFLCTGHFVMVPLNMTYLHCLQHSLFEHFFNLYLYSHGTTF